MNQQPIPMPYTIPIDVLTKDLAAFQNDIERGLLDFMSKEEQLMAKQQIENAISLLKVSSFGGLTALVSLVRQWGVDKGITGPNAKATVQTQLDKLLEEVDEINDGIKSNDQHAIIDGIGDSTVVLILLAELAGVKFETCLLAAYEVIKNRTGVMLDGKFVKDQPRGWDADAGPDKSYGTKI